MNNKKISAVLFVFNEQEYISDLIDSIVDQTHRVDKIIICDDMSSDDTLKIIKHKREALASRVEIKIIHGTKKGKVYAYEKSLKAVDTELFFVCGGDDLIGSNYVKSMYEFILSYDLRFAYTNQVWVNNNLDYIKYKKKKLSYTESDLFYGNPVGGGIFGYSEIIALFTPFPEGLMFEDWYVSLVLSHKYGRCFVNNHKEYLYRRHQGADTHYSSRAEKIKLIQRDISFMSFLIDMGFYEDVFLERVSVYGAMINDITFVQFLKILNLKYITFRERLKLIVIKVIRYY